MRSLVLLLCALLSMGLYAQTEAAPVNVGPGNIGDGVLTVTGNNWVQVSQWVTPGGSPVDLTTYNGGAPVAFRAFVDLQDCAQVAPADWFKFLGELRMVDDSGRMVYCGAVDTQLGMWHGIAPQVWQRLSIETRNVPGWPSSTPHGQEFYCREGGCTDYGTGTCSNGRYTVYPTDQVYYVQLVADPVARTFTLYAFGNGDAGGAAPPTSNNSTPGNKWWLVGSITVDPGAFNFNSVRLQTVLWHSSQALPADTSTFRWYTAHLGPMVSLADQPKPTHVWVDDDYAGGEPPVTPGWGVTRFATILDGLAAVGGSTVHLGPGIYEEQVEVASDVTIEGSGPSSIIKSPVTLPLAFGTNKAVVYVHDTATMALKNLTVDGAGRGNTNNKFIGVAFRNAGGTVENCSVTGIRDTPFSGAQHGVGIYAYNDDGIARAVTVQGCTVVDFQKNAMALNAADTTPMTVDVSGNEVTGAGPTTVTAQNGIQTWGDRITGTIDYNDVSGIAYSGTGWVATSILVFYADVMVDNNTVTDGHTCIYNVDGDCDITNNHLAVIKTGGYGYGIIATDPPAAKPSPFGEESVEAPRTGVLGLAGTASLLVIDISGNSVVFGGPDNVNTVGIEADAGYGPDDLAVTANNNTVTGFDYGMGFWPCTSDCDSGVFTSIVANQNNLAGNTGFGFSTNAAVTADATCNWWGSASGPDAPPVYSNPAGVALEGDATFSPWLVSPTGPCVGTNEVVADVSALGCIHLSDPCATVPVMFNRTDTTPLRAVSVAFELSSELELCGDGVQPGTLFDTYGMLTPYFYVTDNGGGSYTVDYSILGEPCGPTTGGELFTIDVAASGTASPEDVGTITIVSVDARDCGNPFVAIPAMAGAPAEITIDNAPPAAIASLAAAQLKSGNDADGTTVITLTWPAVEAGATVELFRKGFGYYPEYDDLGGVVPSAPADPAAALIAGWTSVGTQVSPYADEIATERDFYYYVAFVTDACGNVSAVSNQTSGTLNYHLGDVMPSAATPPFGDNQVEFLDVSFLGNHYGVLSTEPALREHPGHRSDDGQQHERASDDGQQDPVRGSDHPGDQLRWGEQADAGDDGRGPERGGAGSGAERGRDRCDGDAVLDRCGAGREPAASLERGGGGADRVP